MMAGLAPTIRLIHGHAMPRLGLGTWPMTNREAEQTVAQAIEVGYRLIDTAEKYGNELGVGRGIRASGVAREDLFITTKFNAAWHGYDLAQRAFESSAARLGVDYLDLFLIHWPVPRQNRYVDAWRGLIKLYEDQRVRAIGVSNFKPVHIDRLLAETSVVPDVNQIQLNPGVIRTMARDYHAAHRIVTESWGPIGRGESRLLRAPIITDIAASYAKTPAQVILRWHMDLGLVAVPKTVSPQRLRENLDIFDFQLTAEEISRISSLDGGEAVAVDSDWFGH